MAKRATPAEPSLDQLTFEQAMAQLEELVTAIEAGQISLNDSLQRYEQGVKLVAHCRQLLADAEQKITILTQNADGGVQAEAVPLATFEQPARGAPADDA